MQTARFSCPPSRLEEMLLTSHPGCAEEHEWWCYGNELLVKQSVVIRASGQDDV